MPRYHYERLSAESASHLLGEGSRNFTHSLTALLFEPGPLARPGGGIDLDAIARGIEARIHKAPRFRQRLKWIPYENHPVWVDDGEFNLEYHLRHTSLPAPGSIDNLRKLIGRLMSARLHRSRPMWECWVVEGLADGRIALISKVHNCLVDAASGGDLLQALLSDDPDEEFGAPHEYKPRPVPSGLELARDEFLNRLQMPRRAFERFRNLASDDESLRDEVRRRIAAVSRLLGYSLTPPRATPLNGTLGPHRRFHNVVVPLENLQRIHRAFDCSVHDALLAVLCGGLRRFLRENLVHPASLDFRVSTPVQTRAGKGADEVSQWVVELPLWETEAERIVALIKEQTRQASDTNPALGAQTLFGMARWTGSRMLTLGARSLGNYRPVNMSVTNVPGGAKTLYFMGSKLDESYGITPLQGEQGVAIGVISYDGKLCLAFNADSELVPELGRLVELIVESGDDLLRAARARGRKLSAVKRKAAGSA